MTHANQNHKLFWAEFFWLLFWIVFGALLGWYFHKMLLGIIASLIFFHLLRLYALQRFSEWVQAPIKEPPPDMSSGLTYVATQLYQSQAQEQLAQQKMMRLVKKIRSSLLALQDAVILLDDDDRLEWWNQAAEKLLNLQAEHQGESIFNLITAPEFKTYYHSTYPLTKPQPIANLPTNPSGSSVPTEPPNSASPQNSYNEGVRLNSWHQPERFVQCEVTHFGNEKLLLIYDVTRLQHLEQMRKDFVANVSHELRTPLTVIMGYIETFADQPDLNPKWQRGFSLMQQQTRRMNSIINDLLMLSRLENEEIHEPKCVDMPSLLSHVFDDAQVYNKGYGHFIDLHIDSQHNVWGSEMYLNSALLNLVTNAIKYTPKGGEISISWTAVKNGCLFTVSDTGIGIAKEHIERLTERFYRVDSGRSRETGGTGLGLAIVKHVLYQHDATLKIESIEGQGSTFKVFFPAERICGKSEPSK